MMGIPNAWGKAQLKEVFGDGVKSFKKKNFNSKDKPTFPAVVEVDNEETKQSLLKIQNYEEEGVRIKIVENKEKKHQKQ